MRASIIDTRQRAVVSEDWLCAERRTGEGAIECANVRMFGGMCSIMSLLGRERNAPQSAYIGYQGGGRLYDRRARRGARSTAVSFQTTNEVRERGAREGPWVGWPLSRRGGVGDVTSAIAPKQRGAFRTAEVAQQQGCRRRRSVRPAPVDKLLTFLPPSGRSRAVRRPFRFERSPLFDRYLSPVQCLTFQY